MAASEIDLCELKSCCRSRLFDNVILVSKYVCKPRIIFQLNLSKNNIRQIENKMMKNFAQRFFSINTNKWSTEDHTNCKHENDQNIVSLSWHHLPLDEPWCILSRFYCERRVSLRPSERWHSPDYSMDFENEITF